MGMTADSASVLQTLLDSLEGAAPSQGAAAERADCLQEWCVKTPLPPWKVDRRGEKCDEKRHAWPQPICGHALLEVRTEPRATASLDLSRKLKGCSRTWDDIRLAICHQCQDSHFRSSLHIRDVLFTSLLSWTLLIGPAWITQRTQHTQQGGRGTATSTTTFLHWFTQHKVRTKCRVLQSKCFSTFSCHFFQSFSSFLLFLMSHALFSRHSSYFDILAD